METKGTKLFLNIIHTYKNLILFLTCVLLLTTHIQAVSINSILTESVGGEKAVERIKTLQSVYISGSVNMNGTKGTFEYLLKFPNKYLLSLNFLNFSMIQGFDGETAWQQDISGQKTKLTGSSKKDILSSVYLNTFSFLFDDSLHNKKYLGKTVINNKEYYQIMFTPFPDDTILAYYNILSGNRELFKTKQDLTNTTTFESSYQTIENIRIPFFIQTTIEKFNFTLTQTVENLNFDKPLDDSLFLFQKKSNTNYLFSSQHPITIKFEFQNNQIYIPVTINKSKKIYMLLDTGAGTSIIHQPIAIALNLDSIGVVPAVGASGTTNSQLVRINSLQMSDLHLYNMVVGSLDLSRLLKQKINKVDFGGILGNDFLSQFPILLNFYTQELTIYNPTNYQAPPNGNQIPFEYYNLIPTINCSIGSVNGKFIIDLGNSIGLILHPYFMKTNNLIKKIKKISKSTQLIGGIGGITDGTVGVLDSFKIGTQILLDEKVYLPQSSLGLVGSKEIDGNIGITLLKRFAIFFDFLQNKIILYNDSTSNL